MDKWVRRNAVGMVIGLERQTSVRSDPVGFAHSKTATPTVQQPGMPTQGPTLAEQLLRHVKTSTLTADSAKNLNAKSGDSFQPTSDR